MSCFFLLHLYLPGARDFVTHDAGGFSSGDTRCCSRVRAVLFHSVVISCLNVAYKKRNTDGPSVQMHCIVRALDISSLTRCVPSHPDLETRMLVSLIDLKTQMMALYESEESESLNETLVAQGVARVASNADQLATSQVWIVAVSLSTPPFTPTRYVFRDFSIYFFPFFAPVMQERGVNFFFLNLLSL